MDRVFITDLTIEKVRHLENIEIPLSSGELKHLIITGKNGSGKTSVLDAMALLLGSVSRHGRSLIPYNEKQCRGNNGICLQLNNSLEAVQELFTMGAFILAYYESNRVFHAEIPKHVEKVQIAGLHSVSIKKRPDHPAEDSGRFPCGAQKGRAEALPLFLMLLTLRKAW